MSKSIIAITGSNNNKSKTKEITDRILDELKKIDKNYTCKNIFLSELNLKYCTGCQECFYNGFCTLDKLDDMNFIRKNMLNSDVILMSSSVYALNVSGIMKTLIDRLSYQLHLLDFAGKLGFSLAVTDQSGSEIVNEYLEKILTNLGVKNLSSYSFINIIDSENKKISQIAESINKKIQNNYGYSSYKLESLFKGYKKLHSSYNYLDLELEYELKFWNQSWVRTSDSFQEFATKKRRMNNDFTEK
ncbi:TPA: flavodoxin family protein [Clostridioides difficile]|uniref:flavodoxin family protein n=1 Tax=Clostridioides difficile TaxID=1496 RepID=UPI00093D2DA0|nr:flavodoxin family protein [Clostridioides difficile]HBF2788651.1 flavodoxin family protein [Clostridioides difficile]HBF4062489.1 flavodoxin family protein [Clostridioides difficile]HBG3259745.1 flavodoxin family protein [Clostridioides difficile]